MGRVSTSASVWFLFRVEWGEAEIYNVIMRAGSVDERIEVHCWYLVCVCVVVFPFSCSGDVEENAAVYVISSSIAYFDVPISPRIFYGPKGSMKAKRRYVKAGRSSYALGIASFVGFLDLYSA